MIASTTVLLLHGHCLGGVIRQPDALPEVQCLHGRSIYELFSHTQLGWLAPLGGRTLHQSFRSPLIMFSSLFPQLRSRAVQDVLAQSGRHPAGSQQPRPLALSAHAQGGQRQQGCRRRRRRR